MSPTPSKKAVHCTRHPVVWLEWIAEWPAGTYAEALCARSWQSILLSPAPPAPAPASPPSEASEAREATRAGCMPLAVEWVAASLSTWNHSFTQDEGALTTHLDRALLLIDQCCDTAGQEVSVNALHVAALELRGFNRGEWPGWPACSPIHPPGYTEGGNATTTNATGEPSGSYWGAGWFEGPYRQFFYTNSARRIPSTGGLAMLIGLLLCAMAIIISLVACKRHQIRQRKHHRRLAAYLLGSPTGPAAAGIGVDRI